MAASGAVANAQQTRAKPTEPALPPPVIERLSREPTTLFDMGMKRLRRLALEATTRLAPVGGKPPSARVWYKPDSGTIEIRFEAPLPATPVLGQSCNDYRARAIRETLAIYRVAYPVNLSYSERVRRRFGLLFAHEPLLSGTEAIAVGQKLAELTFVTLAYMDSAGAQTLSCRGPLVAPTRQ